MRKERKIKMSEEIMRTTYFSSSSNILAQRGERRNVSVNEESFASIAFFFRSGSLNEDDNGRDEE